jgi:hypothetical protein
MRVAIVTGASSGIGREFAVEIPRFYQEKTRNHNDSDNIQEIWLIGRNRERLEEMKVSIRTKILPLDLQKENDLEKLRLLLEEAKPDVRMLINAAGCAEKGLVSDMTNAELVRMVDLNCRALMLITQIVTPYMGRDSYILQMASAAAFTPHPGEAVYAATKSFVFSYSRALNREYHNKGITVTAVCPGPVDTAMLLHLHGGGRPKGLRRWTVVTPKAVVRQAFADAQKRKEVSVCGIWMKLSRFLCKIVPHRIILNLMPIPKRKQ